MPADSFTQLVQGGNVTPLLLHAVLEVVYYTVGAHDETKVMFLVASLNTHDLSNYCGNSGNNLFYYYYLNCLSMLSSLT